MLYKISSIRLIEDGHIEDQNANVEFQSELVNLFMAEVSEKKGDINKSKANLFEVVDKFYKKRKVMAVRFSEFDINFLKPGERAVAIRCSESFKEAYVFLAILKKIEKVNYIVMYCS